MFEFTSSLFFWTLINFLILLFLISKFALPAFFKMVEESENAKQQAMDELEHNRLESRRLLSDYQGKLAQIQDEIRQIKSQAVSEAEEFKKKEFAKITDQKEALLAGIKGEVESEKQKFIEDMKLHAANLIVSTTKKVIHKEVLREDHEALILQNIADFEKLIKEAA